MFLRRKTKSVRGVPYSYWYLCETVRTTRGPRQRRVTSLAKLDASELAGLRGGRDDLPALLRGGGTADTSAGHRAVARLRGRRAARRDLMARYGLRVDDVFKYVETGLGGRVATTGASLLPIFWSTRTGAEVMQPIAAPVIGGMLSSLVHILVVTPVIFAWLHERKLAPTTAGQNLAAQ
jgi:hypothetical protein